MDRQGQTSNISQRELNSLHEGPILDMAQRYSNFLLLFMLTMFYTPLLPITPLITGCGATMQYWIEKYMLLRVHSRPEMMGAFMAETISSIFPYIIALYGFSNYYFFRDLQGSNLIGLISLCFCAIALLIPQKQMVRYFTKEVARKPENTYQRHMLDFDTDYDRANPVTDEEATIQYLKTMEQNATTDHDKVNRMIRQTIKHRVGVRDTLAQYVKRDGIRRLAGDLVSHNIGARISNKVTFWNNFYFRTSTIHSGATPRLLGILLICMNKKVRKTALVDY